MEEKRKFVRVKGLPEVNFRVKGSIEKKRKIPIKDLSFVGINLYADLHLEDGTIVELELDIPGVNNPISITGKTIWQLPGRGNRFATGVRFDYDNEKYRKVLSKFIYECASRIDEAREFIRCGLDSEVECYYPDSPQEKFKAKSLDISRGGIKMFCERKINSGDCLHFKLKLDKLSDPVEFDGKVVWVSRCEDSEQCESGIVFTVFGTQEKDTIGQFIEKSCGIRVNK